MPKELYDIRNYPRRSGTSQLQRTKPALTGNEVKIDERTIADFILFAHRLSQHITYYNLNNVPQGNWSSFLQNDITYHLAEATAVKSIKWQQVWQELMENVEGVSGTAATDNDYQQYFTWRFHFLYTLINRLMNAYAHSSLLPAWHSDLQALFSSAHLVTLYLLLEKYAQASETLLLANATAFSYNDIRLLSKETVASELLQYGEEVLSLLGSSQSFLEDATFIFGEAETIPEKVAAASEYLDELANQLISVYNSVTILADKYLIQTLENDNTHQPHVGLFYAFLMLSEEHRNEMNSLVLRHLDFYYKDVLGVRPKTWKPAQTFVMFELAKNVMEYFLQAGTLLQAGKDGERKDVYYRTLQDIVVTKTEVTDIRSFTILKNISATQKNVRTSLGLFGSIVANSADGAGKPLVPGQSWDAFKGNNAAGTINQKIGLAFYSELLHQVVADICTFEIQIKLLNTTLHNKAATFIEKYGSIKVTTDKEPLLLPVTTVVTGGFIKISFTVSGKKNINKTSPNASLIFGNKYESVDASDMDAITTFQTERIVNLFFTISNYTLKVNNVETAAGFTDVSSAFPAFGGVPKSGSTFSVIAPLLRNKTVSSLHLLINWAANTERGFSVSTSFANQTIPGKVVDNTPQSELVLIDDKSSVTFSDDWISIKLLENLGHNDYANKMTAAILTHQEEPDETNAEVLAAFQKYITEKKIDGFQLNNLSISKNNPFNPPPIPYTPMIKSLELTGNFKETIFSDGSSIDKVFRQYPYGIKKVADALNVFLLPSFTLSSSIATSAEGELYIGLKNVLPGQRLQLLFTVEEGGANPSLQNPQVSWSCLQYDSWVSFAEGNLHDDTNNLIQSGIVSFLLPDVDITSHQLLPAGLCWIKAAVPFNQSSAVAPIISIHPQAVLAEFTNRDNATDYLGSNIPANTITTLFPKQAAIKIVTQPYPSFNGQQTEQAAQVYTRTSERLRHKSRSVTAWDYEHIILEKFLDIYKVKVLHHACLYADSTGNTKKIISKAGSVLVLVMPKTYSQTGIYKPLVSKAKLTAIHQFIQSLSSPFAQFTVMNPLFDEIVVSFGVVFTAAVKDRLVFEKKVKEDVQRFLSPWAFTDAVEPEFGGVIYRSSLIDFIESLPYVDYVKNLRLSLSSNSTNSLDSVAASSPASILISSSTISVIGELQTHSEEIEKQSTIAFC
jgi:hypothetical protein